MHHGGVIEFFAGGTGCPWPGKCLKARTAIGIAPAGSFDFLGFEGGFNSGHIKPLGVQ